MHIDHFKETFQSILSFDVLFGSLCAVIAGTKSWFDIREYILGHHDWFKTITYS